MNQEIASHNESHIGVFPVGFAIGAETTHIGINEVPFVEVAEGVELQLLHVDLNVGMWINRTRLRPGTTVPTHFHTGMVLAVTLEGSWHYLESPNQVNTPGSYLFEPASSVHTLHAPEDQEGSMLTWFAIWGANVNLDGQQNVTAVLDAHAILTIYRSLCAQAGLDCSRLIVVGEA
ncbi:2,4'-dihydroxyacetophenone dioxygenase family protein [Cupriavidus sp. 2SB]|uniref:2,4'-dihydroxyacetophenone dioxygenase family protein n=1 Tax=Cupriavidus sp. 2SB TaxID=2502199 RepID=UPI0010F5AE06|nr:2,4'-dihydroxyacetophenone dioxygenase family protein [Cupriavidus sp. 2SB]